MPNHIIQKFILAAPRPKPRSVDNAYFSAIPKLIIKPKQPGKPLGLSIMTREVRDYRIDQQLIIAK